LRELLALKGGTAINLTMFNLPRLSVAGAQSVSRRNKWGQFGENLGRVKFPWSGIASRHLLL
jgi:hypothetical protein